MKLRSKVNRKERLDLFKIPFFTQSAESFTKLVMYKRITDSGYVVDRDNHYQAFLKIRTRDLNSLNQDERILLMSRLANTYRMYTETLKLIAMTHSMDISDEMAYLNKLINRYKRLMVSADEEKRRDYHHKIALIREEMMEWKKEESEVQERAFYFVVYGRTEKEVVNHVDRLIRFGGPELDLQHERDRENIERIVFKLSNKSTLV